jgi:hypothetical protein
MTTSESKALGIFSCLTVWTDSSSESLTKRAILAMLFVA